MKFMNLIQSNRIRFLYTTTAINFIFGFVKCITAITISSSLFTISGLYNFALCIGKIPYLHWNKQTQAWDMQVIRRSEKKNLLLMSWVIVALGVLFTAFGAKMFYSGEEVYYSNHSVYAISLCAFVKLGVSIYWMTKLRGIHQPMEFTIKLTNFSDALVSIVLAQSALLVMKGIEEAAYYDGIFGVAVGIAVILIGTVSVFRSATGNAGT